MVSAGTKASVSSEARAVPNGCGSNMTLKGEKNLSCQIPVSFWVARWWLLRSFEFPAGSVKI